MLRFIYASFLLPGGKLRHGSKTLESVSNPRIWMLMSDQVRLCISLTAQ